MDNDNPIYITLTCNLHQIVMLSVWYIELYSHVHATWQWQEEMDSKNKNDIQICSHRKSGFSEGLSTKYVSNLVSNSLFSYQPVSIFPSYEQYRHF